MRDQLARERDGRSPTEAEWAELCGMSVMELRKVMQHGQQAREALVSANVGLVTSIAKRHYQALRRSPSSSSLRPTLADLIQEGNVGILSAAERFQPEKGFRFSTYATWWIRQRIVRSISDSSRIIRLPAHVQSTLTRMYKARRGLTALLGREPTPSELAHELDMPVEKLQRYTDSSRHVLSLEVPLRSASSKPDRRTLMDVLASDAPTPEEDAQSNYLRRDIQAVMENELAERERHVIAHRFGLVDGKSRTHAETAKLLGISRDRVRLVEARALNKLRSPQRNYRLKEYVITSSSSSSLVSSVDAKNAPQRTSVYREAPAADDASSPWPSSTPSTFASRQPGSDRIWFF
jgi:RNA polymerase primary sigma factor